MLDLFDLYSRIYSGMDGVGTNVQTPNATLWIGFDEAAFDEQTQNSRRSDEYLSVILWLSIGLAIRLLFQAASCYSSLWYFISAMIHR